MEKKSRFKLGNFGDEPQGERRQRRREFFINNALYIFLVIVIIAIAIYRPRFVSPGSIVNIISLSAANLPIALGIAGAIILTGTDLSAGRIVGAVACVSASLLQASGYPSKVFPDLPTLPLPLVIIIALSIGAIVGLINGFCTAHFNLHPFIVTLSTQLIVYGALLMYLMIGNNNGQFREQLIHRSALCFAKEGFCTAGDSTGEALILCRLEKNHKRQRYG